MGKLFGTDGIRGIAGEYPLDPATVHKVGAALTAYLRRSTKRPRILIGRDTRVSGLWIQGALTGAISGCGGDSEICGILTTPALSILTERSGSDAGIMISASHNPYEDNGIKVFSGRGIKFTDDVELELEASILSMAPSESANAALQEQEESSFLYSDESSHERYYAHLRDCLPRDLNLDSMHLVVDCAHGAAYKIAPEFLGRMGARVQKLHCEPNGRNINRDAGALHLDRLKDEVLASKADLGIAFDGDADRVIFVDRSGTVRDGDDVLFLLAVHSTPAGAPRIVVGTVMANLGLEMALDRHGFQLVRTAVGDRYVFEEMTRLGAEIGGEQSGHIILTRHAGTGDGLLTALKILEILLRQNRDISELCEPLKRFPQVLINVRVSERLPFSEIPGLQECESALRVKLGPRSRILLRYSGTEPLARVMVEGEDESLVKQAAKELASRLESIVPANR